MRDNGFVELIMRVWVLLSAICYKTLFLLISKHLTLFDQSRCLVTSQKNDGTENFSTDQLQIFKESVKLIP